MMSPETATHALLRCDDLVVHFGAGPDAVRAVDGVSLQIAPGETLGLVGESGSGKSTLGRTLLGLIQPTAGSIQFQGRDIRAIDPAIRRRRIAMVFQNPLASLNPRLTVRSILADPLRVNGIGGRAERLRKVDDSLALVGLDPALGGRYPHQFSGGQRQRIGIARALMLDPELLICDEPVSALDVSIQAQILNLLREVQQRLGLGILLISHDLAVVRHLADRIAVMYVGKLMESGPRDAVYRQPGHPYTRALLDAVHVPDPGVERSRRHVLLSGDIPNPSAPPPGCRFQTRCPRRRELGDPADCTAREPRFEGVGPDHQVACHFSSAFGASTAPHQPAFIKEQSP